MSELCVIFDDSCSFSVLIDAVETSVSDILLVAVNVWECMKKIVILKSRSVECWNVIINDCV